MKGRTLVERGALAVICLLAVSVVLSACSPIPTAPVEEGQGGDLVYANESWGFQITRPDSTWGFSAQIYYQDREANGLPRVEIRLLAPQAISTTTFRPVLYMKPSPLSEDATLDSLVSDIEQALEDSFAGYDPGEKSAGVLATKPAMQWQFELQSSSQLNFLTGDRFFVTAVQNGTHGYLLVGSGISGSFPVEAYRQIASNIVFTR